MCVMDTEYPFEFRKMLICSLYTVKKSQPRPHPIPVLTGNFEQRLCVIRPLPVGNPKWFVIGHLPFFRLKRERLIHRFHDACLPAPHNCDFPDNRRATHPEGLNSSISCLLDLYVSLNVNDVKMQP
jgi:hypothetical protein